MRTPTFWAGVMLGVAVYPGTQLVVRLLARTPLLYPR